MLMIPDEQQSFPTNRPNAAGRSQFQRPKILFRARGVERGGVVVGFGIERSLKIERSFPIPIPNPVTKRALKEFEN